jgi:hypothetical protein
MIDLPSTTQGGSRVRELRMLGSVRGASSNGRPYRDRHRDAACTRPRQHWAVDHDSLPHLADACS